MLFSLLHFVNKFRKFHVNSSGLRYKVLKISHFFFIIIQEFMVFSNIDRKISIPNIVLQIVHIPLQRRIYQVGVRKNNRLLNRWKWRLRFVRINKKRQNFKNKQDYFSPIILLCLLIMLETLTYAFYIFFSFFVTRETFGRN